MSIKKIELLVGLFVIFGIIALFFLAMQVSGLSGMSATNTYHLSAHFDNIGGLKVRSPITMSGVKIGRVTKITYNQDTYEAIVAMKIEKKYNKIPDDTFAKIVTAGLLGEQFISLDPGGSETFYHNNAQITVTQSALVLEDIVGQFLFSKAQEGAGQ